MIKVLIKRQIICGEGLDFFRGWEGGGWVVWGNEFFGVKGFLWGEGGFESGGMGEIDFLSV